MIHQLPAEVLLHIFGFLPLRALAACQGVSSAWLALVAAHSGCLYRSVMALEGLTAACRPAGSNAHAVEDWRETCRQAKLLASNWYRCRATSGWLVNPGRDVWRIKLDEAWQSVIMTARGGGLSVVDLQTNQHIQRISGVRPHAHIEFDQGYLVHDNPDGQSHTVYRRRADIAREGGSVEGDADLRAFDVWGTLDSPGLVRAYRLVHPHLLVGGMDPGSAWIWDVPSCTLLATIALESDDFGHISYVELTPAHMIILKMRHMSVYKRPTDPSANPFDPLPGLLVLSFPSARASAVLALPSAEDIRPTEPEQPRRMRRANVGFTTRGDEVLSFGLGLAASDGLETRVRALTAETARKGPPHEAAPVQGLYGFDAVHPCGEHLFAISKAGYVFVVLDYGLVFANPSRLEAKHTFVIDVREALFNLACSDRGAVITSRKRVMYMAHDDLPTVADLERYRAEGEPLALIVHQLLDVTEIAAEVISSVQMDSARIALSYYVKADDLDETRPGAPPLLAWRGGLTAVKVLDFGPTEPVPAKALALVEQRLTEL